MVHLFKANFDVCHVSFRQNLKHVLLFPVSPLEVFSLKEELHRLKPNLDLRIYCQPNVCELRFRSPDEQSSFGLAAAATYIFSNVSMHLRPW